MRTWSSAWGAVLMAWSLSSGCGLVLDTDPDSRAEPAQDGGPRDATARRDGARRDARTALCTATPCRLLSPQCGCAPREVCRYTRDLARVCAPPGTRLRGDRCAANADCGGGLHCTLVADGVGLCEPFCNDAMMCGRGAFCLALLGPFGVIRRVGACTTPCSPLADTGCPTGHTCDITTERRLDGRLISGAYCRPSGTARPGAACLPGARFCRPGLTCQRGRLGAARCRTLCEVGGTPCAVGRACMPLAPPLMVGGAEVGYCAG